MKITCPDCRGTGEVDFEECERCQGKGEIDEPDDPNEEVLQT